MNPTEPTPAVAAPGPPAAERRAAEALIVEIARALHEAGAPAHRIEDAMALLSPRLGVLGHFFVTPTSVIASFGTPGEERTALLRMNPASLDLERLDDVNRLLADLEHGRVPVDGARRHLAALVSRPARYAPWVTVAAFGLASATVARFFGGGPAEIGVGAVIGLQTALLALAMGARPAAAQLFELLAAFAAAVTALLGCAIAGPLVPEVAVAAGLIVLIPGLTLSVAINELATRNLVSGTARMAGAGLTFLALGLGVALGSRFRSLVGAAAVAEPVAPLPGWTELLALVLTPIALMVLFRARPRHLPVILVAGILTFTAARLGTRASGPEVGMLLAAFVAGACGNLDARFFGRPAAVSIVPSVLVLIPGTLGVRGVATLVTHDVVPGIELLFRLFVFASALTAGLLFANLLVPPRRSL